MSIDKSFVISALLQHNFLPAQKRAREELPSVVTSATFVADVAKKLYESPPRKADGYPGYDSVEYRLTRFNGVSRSCAIPHPMAYAGLAMCISEHWDKLEYISSNKTSQVRPRKHIDGRLFIMDYEKSFERTKRNLRKSFGRRFLVRTDIANFFPAIYTHAVAWATVGFAHAKEHKGPKHKDEWFNQLDEKLRLLCRGETQGVAIGPATSNIVSEAILTRVDESLAKNFDYVRFVDDYTAFCRTEDEAQEFVRRLGQELASYKLVLNINKTEIIPLPRALAADWVSELAIALPKGKGISGYDATTYLNLAVQLANGNPDGSVLKYALRSLIRSDLGILAASDVLRYAVTLSYHQPVLLPLLEALFERTLLSDALPYADELQVLARESALYRRSDGMAWALYYLNCYGVGIAAEVAAAVIESRDCLGLLLLYLGGNAAHQAKVVDFAEGLDRADLYGLDQYWILLYQLFCDGKIANPYMKENCFEVMQGSGVTFTKPLGVKLQEVKKKNLAKLLDELLG